MTHMEHLSSTDISSTITVAEETEYAKIFLNEYNKQDAELILKYKNGETDAMFISESNDSAQLTHEFKDDENYKNSYSDKDPEKISKTDRETYGSFTTEQYADITADNHTDICIYTFTCSDCTFTVHQQKEQSRDG